MRMSNAAEMTIGSIPPVPFQQEGQPLDSGEIIAIFFAVLLALNSGRYDGFLFYVII